jgi:hypothetical protein
MVGNGICAIGVKHSAPLARLHRQNPKVSPEGSAGLAGGVVIAEGQSHDVTGAETTKPACAGSGATYDD